MIKNNKINNEKAEDLLLELVRDSFKKTVNTYSINGES